MAEQCGRCRTGAVELAQARRELHNAVLRREEAEESLEARTAQLKAMALELTHAEQRERQRLASVLHDHLQQLLVAAQLSVARMAMPLDKREQQEAVREATAILDEAIIETRSLAVELAPPVLLEDGLVPALEWLGRWMRQKHGLTIQVTAADEGMETGDEKTRQVLFTAVRELLFNITKHAKVTTANVRVQRVGGQIQIVVEDKGIGFAALESEAPGNTGAGLGLFNIRHRLDLIGGRFEMVSAPGKGSRFTMQAPIGRRAC